MSTPWVSGQPPPAARQIHGRVAAYLRTRMASRSPVTLVLLFLACSEPSELDPGTFRARLGGALDASLTGSALAETVFVGEFPEPLFSIRMLAEQGDTGRALSIQCPSDGPLMSGSYAVTAVGRPCAGRYLRFVSSPDGRTTVLESMQATSGSLTVESGSDGQAAGRFSLSGPLVAGTESAGVLSAFGSFSADLIP